MENQHKENILKDKSYAFAFKANEYLLSERTDYVLAKQLLRSGTSIGANVAEANQAQFRPDFVSKMSIALKEAVETEYWLSLLKDSQYLTQSQADSLISDCGELKTILTAAIKTTKKNSQFSVVNSQL
jgi:four helix bundle protein